MMKRLAILWMLMLIACTPGMTAVAPDAPTSTATSQAEAATPTNTALASETPTPAMRLGASLVRETDGAAMMYVPKGSFPMGADEGYVSEGPQHGVYLNAYWIDRTEVTYAAYDKCTAAGKCTEAGQGRNPDTAPVLSVAWQDARNYCEWVGGRLPTDAEWEKAARGTDGKRLYPWGAELDNTKLAKFTWDGILEPVGQYPEGASPYGVLDMAGGAFEWVSDWYAESYYLTSPDSNPPGPESGEQHVIRGGWWEYCPAKYICNLHPTYRSTFRNGTGNYGRGGNGPSWIYYPWAGFRCAADEDMSGVISTPGPTITPTVNPKMSPTPTFTATIEPSATPIIMTQGSIPLEYGTKAVSVPRQETLQYAFTGAEGDEVQIMVKTNIIHEKILQCQQKGPTSRGRFVVQTTDGKDLEAQATENGGVSRTYVLPYSGFYYIQATCSGLGCNAFCMEQVVSVDLAK